MRSVAAWLAFLIAQPLVLAQSSMPTNNVLTRITMVESAYGRGSMFSIDIDGREYWITAKHVVTGSKHPPFGSITHTSVSLNVLDPGAPIEKWSAVSFTAIDTEKDVDIVVLAPSEVLLKNPLPSVKADSSGAFLGGDCEFLGFPFGGGWRVLYGGQSYVLPFVKHCTVSAIVNKSTGTALTKAISTEDRRVWILDGINNEGFSGGPVFFRTGQDQQIMGVVSGYFTEPTEVVPAVHKTLHKSSVSDGRPKHQKEKVDINTGFIIAFDIQYALDAARKQPLGPLRKRQ
jgi:hypothetical protein